MNCCLSIILRQGLKILDKAHPEVVKVGYFGSYARGDWNVGSYVDIVVVVSKSHEPFIRRPLAFDTTELPVPVDLLVYTQEEIEKLKDTRFYREVLQKEVVWLS